MRNTNPQPAFLKDSVLIVCHPDDEVLWFGSILKDVDRVIVAYQDYWAQPGLGAARAAALADFPRPIESLGLAESGSYGQADWANPTITELGIGFRSTTSRLREVKRRIRRLGDVRMLGRSSLDLAPAPDASVAERYRENAVALATSLRPILSPGMNVFTHNPWGEYGHEDHIQMFRVLDRLRDEIGFTLWISNYCTERSLPLAKRYFQINPERSIRLPVDREFCDVVASTYKRHDCWTWADDWVWFEDECFMRAPKITSREAPQRHLFAMNMFTINEEAHNRWMLAAGLSAAGVGLAVALSEMA
jgi:LmbE family N-acetylglucosaminyl deacetylase